MQFLRTLFAVVVAVVAVVFSLRNWTTVTVHLWGGIDADVKLPVMLLAAFLIGFLPVFMLHRASRWRLRRRLETAERAVALQNIVPPPLAIEPATSVAGVPPGGTLPPAGPAVPA